MPITLSFISANYVARASNYDGKPDWGYHDRKTVESAGPQSFTEICRDVAAADFDAIDIWTAHCHFQHHAEGDYLEQVKGICSNYDLAITSYAGGLSDDTHLDTVFRFMKQLGAPIFAGGYWGDYARCVPVIAEICMKYQLRYAFENHPEKTPDEILAKIAGGKFPNVGVALDTGWCGTQGMDALEALKRLREKIFIVHLKDVKAQGKHDTCALGDGIVGIENIVRHLKDTRYDGALCIEHEPYDRDPLPEVKESLKRVKEWLG